MRLMKATFSWVGSGVGSGVTVGGEGDSVGVSVGGKGLPWLGPLPQAATSGMVQRTKSGRSERNFIDTMGLPLLLCCVTAMTETSSA
jgi:hypothetical protein